MKKKVSLKIILSFLLIVFTSLLGEKMFLPQMPDLEKKLSIGSMHKKESILTMMVHMVHNA